MQAQTAHSSPTSSKGLLDVSKRGPQTSHTLPTTPLVLLFLLFLVFIHVCQFLCRRLRNIEESKRNERRLQEDGGDLWCHPKGRWSW